MLRKRTQTNPIQTQTNPNKPNSNPNEPNFSLSSRPTSRDPESSLERQVTNLRAQRQQTQFQSRDMRFAGTSSLSKAAPPAHRSQVRILRRDTGRQARRCPAPGQSERADTAPRPAFSNCSVNRGFLLIGAFGLVLLAGCGALFYPPFRAFLFFCYLLVTQGFALGYNLQPLQG